MIWPPKRSWIILLQRYVCILRKSCSLLDNAPNYLLLLRWVSYPKGAVQWPAVQILTTGLHNIIYNLWKNDYLWLDLICTWDIVQEIVIESLLFLRSNSLNLQNVDICNYLHTYLRILAFYRWPTYSKMIWCSYFNIKFSIFRNTQISWAFHFSKPRPRMRRTLNRLLWRWQLKSKTEWDLPHRQVKYALKN